MEDPPAETDPRGEAGVDRRLPLTWDHGRAPARPRRPAVERAASAALTEALRAHRPDVVSVWNMAGLPGTLLTTLASTAVPVVGVLADAWPARILEGDPWLGPLHRHPWLAPLARLTGVATTLPDPVLAGTVCYCSAHLRDRVAASLGRSDDAGVVTPLGVDARDFPTDPAPPPSAAWDWRLLFVGRLDAAKGVDTLVRATALLPADTRLDLVGPQEPAHVDRLTGLIAALGLADRVRIGPVPRDRLRERYLEADVVVFPSEWEEPFGIVPLEAMACATPVVATGTGGSSEYLRDGDNCRLFAAGDERALAAAVTGLAGDPQLRARLVAGGLATASELTTERLARQLEGVHAAAATAAASGSGPTPGP